MESYSPVRVRLCVQFVSTFNYAPHSTSLTGSARVPLPVPNRLQPRITNAIPERARLHATHPLRPPHTPERIAWRASRNSAAFELRPSRSKASQQRQQQHTPRTNRLRSCSNFQLRDATRSFVTFSLATSRSRCSSPPVGGVAVVAISP